MSSTKKSSIHTTQIVKLRNHLAKTHHKPSTSKSNKFHHLVYAHSETVHTYSLTPHYIIKA